MIRNHIVHKVYVKEIITSYTHNRCRMVEITCCVYKSTHNIKLITSKADIVFLKLNEGFIVDSLEVHIIILFGLNSVNNLVTRSSITGMSSTRRKAFLGSLLLSSGMRCRYTCSTSLS